MKNIVIINAYGSKNIGDAAIIEVTKEIIEEALNESAEIYIMCEDINAINISPKSKNKIIPLQLPYGHAIHRGTEKLSGFEKSLRFLYIFIKTYLYLFLSVASTKFLPKNGFFSYIKMIKDSDVIIGAGGGYFRTKNSFKDFFGLYLTLLPIYVSKFYKKRILFLPISFGPFASFLQQFICYRGLRGTKVICRDKISYKKIRQLDKKKNKVQMALLPDLALFLNPPKLIPGINSYIVLTARAWFDDNKQSAYEKILADFINYVYKNYQLKTVFIPMAHNPIDDDDTKVAENIQHMIKDKRSFLVSISRTPFEVQNDLKRAVAAICTRLHSAILATTVNTPFITIAYETKTIGYMEMLRLKQWNLDIDKITLTSLIAKFEKLNQPLILDEFKDKLKKNILKVQPSRNLIKKQVYEFIYQ